MRIIHVIPTLGCGGAEILLCNIALEQVKRGCRVEIICLEPFHFTYPNYQFRVELEKNVQIHIISPKISFSFLKNRIEINNEEYDAIVNKFRPDVIHSHLFQAELVSRYKIDKSIKYITHCHSNMDQLDLFSEKPLKRRISDYLEKRWLFKKYMECNNTFIAISLNTKEYFIRNIPSKLRGRVFLLKNAINLSLFFWDSEKENDSIFRLISVGNLLENKGHSFLIDVIQLLVKQGIKLHLDILGFGPQKEALENKINLLSLGSHITLHGNVSNVNEFMSKAHLYVHSSINEGFGLVLIEAMASKLPIVSTDGKGNRDLIIDDFNGYLIMKRDIDLFANKIKFFINNTAVRKKMGENAFEFSKSYDMVGYVDQLQELYAK